MKSVTGLPPVNKKSISIRRSFVQGPARAAAAGYWPKEVSNFPVITNRQCGILQIVVVVLPCWGRSTREVSNFVI